MQSSLKSNRVHDTLNITYKQTPVAVYNNMIRFACRSMSVHIDQTSTDRTEPVESKEKFNMYRAQAECIPYFRDTPNVIFHKSKEIFHDELRCTLSGLTFYIGRHIYDQILLQVIDKHLSTLFLIAENIKNSTNMDAQDAYKMYVYVYAVLKYVRNFLKQYLSISQSVMWFKFDEKQRTHFNVRPKY